ncbi:unannotated protein [freshwater metagenome]|uniref:Unannotated protein n=1 Tax=freshwater metagenome TaxID=449393 RepID=A0A6J6CKJ1_9ZZZZ
MSSAAGSSRSFTAVSFTEISASWPALSPPTNFDLNVVSSPAVRVSSASSIPSKRFPEPISYEMFSAESMVLPSTTAIRSMVVKSPFLAGRSTDFRLPNLALRASSSASSSFASTETSSTLTFRPLYSLSSSSGRTSTSISTIRFPSNVFSSGLCLMSAAGCPSGRNFDSSRA